jgi:hypothetical protein
MVANVHNASVVDPLVERSVPALIRQMQLFVKRRRRDVLDMFAQYDPLRSGRINTNQFRRCLNVQGLCALNDAELAAMLGVYAHAQDKMEIAYKRFVDDVTKLLRYPYSEMLVENVPVIGDTMETDIVDASAIVQQRPLTAAEETRVQHVITLLQKAVITQRIGYANFFRAHDAVNSGMCTPTQFTGVLGSLGLMRIICLEDTELLCQRYAVHSNARMVSYRLFCSDMETARSKGGLHGQIISG